MNSKPPIGITPRWLLDEERKKEINNAIERYNNAGYSIPIEWYQELNEIDKRLYKTRLLRIERLYYQAIYGLEKYK